RSENPKLNTQPIDMLTLINNEDPNDYEEEKKPEEASIAPVQSTTQPATDPTQTQESAGTDTPIRVEQDFLFGSGN
ncbi:MAG: hypothetical protein QNJ72_43205, partial [Pleurocapsa sp. MO_226.B13]|nr:hypothetical protein [Pleurocapsa sp. MO_226.B13]